MRIITGKARGIKLVTLEGEATRPTTEMTKEAVFSSIQFDIEGRRVLDIFAGSGQMGLEALSRGAESCTFTDNNPDAIKIITQNYQKSKLEGGTVLLADWKAFIKKGGNGKKYNLVFVDPPYAAALCGDVLRRLIEGELLDEKAIVVLESGSDEYISADGFQIKKHAKYGKSFITILEKQ